MKSICSCITPAKTSRSPGMRLIRAGRPPGVGHVPVGISVQKLACDVWLIGTMMGLLRRNQYDVVHAVEEAIFPAAVLSSVANRPRIIYDMDSSLADQLTDKWTLLKPLRGLFETLERSVVRRSDVTLAVCEDLAAKVRPWMQPGRVTVLPDIPDCGASAGAQVESLRDQVDPYELLGLYVGNLEEYQGVGLLLEGLARLDATVRFRMVVIGGDPEVVEQYRERARSLGISDRVTFIGKRPLEHLPSYLAQADVLLSPRRIGANTPMKIYWYLQAGKPILATNIRSHTQVLDAHCAYLVDPTADSIAAGIRRLAGDAELRVSLSAERPRKRRNPVRAKYSARACCMRISRQSRSVDQSLFAIPADGSLDAFTHADARRVADQPAGLGNVEFPMMGKESDTSAVERRIDAQGHT